MARLAVLAVLATACSPYGGGAFNCTMDDQCGAGGKCAAGFCAFVDGECPSGYKYGELSGPSSNQCVASGSAGDGGVDTPSDGPGQPCFGTSLVHACFDAKPSGTITFGTNTTIDTDTSSMCATLASPTTSPWCVIAAQTIQVQQGFTLRANGSRPLVLIASGSITIAGTVDVSSKRGGMAGAGAGGAACNPGNAPNNGGGGQGGSLGGKGGDGGASGAGGSGGTAGNAPTLTALQGGCSGTNGAGSNAGAGSAGGGAVFMIATTSIFVSGTIDASGAGGGGAANSSSGGGGGGAGGYIGLESPLVQANGSSVIFANGGGGGQGSGSTTFGNNGADATSPTTPAQGGQPNTGGSSSVGGAGGNGAASTSGGANGGNGSSVGGGGAGGGGSGIVHVVPSQVLGGLVSPPQT